MRFTIFLTILLTTLSLFAKPSCYLPIRDIATPLKKSSWKNYPDLKRNISKINGLCLYRVHFKENGRNWQMLLIFNPSHPKGAFWFLPHDDENSAFDSALYATRKYGGGFLSVVAGGKRYFMNQDPNRNFGVDAKTANECRGMKYPSPIYTNTIFSIIDHFRKNAPYLALHNNANGYYKDGGRGTISILHSSAHAKAFPAFSFIKRDRGGRLNDEDTMVYIAGTSPNPPKEKINRLNSAGINVKYEWVDSRHNDCSMSNYVVLNKNTTNYLNIETEKGDSKTQKEIIDILINKFNLKF